MSKEAAVQALSQLLSMLEPNKIRYRGLLGIPGQTDPAVSGRPNYVWFQEDGNPSKVRQIFNTKVPSITDLPVIVGQDSNNPGFEQVLDIDIGMLPNWLGRAFLPEHHGTHELGAIDAVGNRIDSDVVYVQKAQFVPLSARAQTTPDMTLYIEPDYYLYGTMQRYWGGGSTKTFSAPVTDGYAAYELVCIDGATNQLTYVRGVDFPTAAPRDETLIPDTPLGALPVVAVYLPHGVSTLTYENMADTRMFQATLGGSITGMPHRHTSEFDGGMLSSGLSITGEVLLRRGSDDAVMGRWYDEVGEIHLSGGLTTTGDVIITGGTLQIRDTTTSFVGDSVIDSDVYLGKITWEQESISGYGRKLHFSGGPSWSNWNSDNSDPLWVARANIASDQTELRINIGDNGLAADALVAGYTTAGSVWNVVFRLQMDGNLVLPKASGKGIKVDNTTPTFGWRDLLGQIKTRGVGATDPNDATYRGNIKAYQFDVNDEAWIEYHIPHDYVLGTDIHLHFHWSHNSAIVTGGSVTWGADVTYAKGHNQAAFPATVNPTVVGNVSTTQYQHIITEVQISASSPSAAQIDSDDLEPDGIMHVRVYLSSNDITSSGSVPDPFLHFADVHYQSTNIATKQKAPDFYT